MAETRAAAIIFLFLLAFASADFAGTAAHFKEDEPPTAKVNISDVTISSDPLYAGGSTDIYVSLNNYGTLAANVTTILSIHNSTGEAVALIVYDPAIVPMASSSIISQSWSTAGFPVGLYYANASATYNESTNITNSFIRAFSILSPPIVQPSSTPPQGGSYVAPSSVTEGNASPYVPTTIPVVKPVITDLRFLKITLLKEVVAGDSAFESVELKNIAKNRAEVAFKISGIPDGWLTYSPTEAVMLLSEQRVVNIGINVPSDALVGDYLLKMEATEGNKTAIDYMVLRVKPFRKDAMFPVVLKTIRLNRLTGTSDIAIDVRNPTSRILPSIMITEQLLEGFKVGKDALEFETKPPLAFIDSDPLGIKWRISKLAPGELVRISYSVDALLSEYRPYIYWSVRQVELLPTELKVANLISIRELKASAIYEGGSSEVVAKIAYAGFEPLNFIALLEMPEGFEVVPEKKAELLTPASVTPLKFSVKSPRKSAGTHTFSLILVFNGNQLSEISGLEEVPQNEDYLIKYAGYLVVQPPPALSLQNLLIVIFIVSIIFIAIIRFISSRKEVHERRRNAELRSGYLKQIKEHIKSK